MERGARGVGGLSAVLVMLLSCSGFMARDRCQQPQKQQQQLEESSQEPAVHNEPSDSAASTLAVGFGPNPDPARITWPRLGSAWVLPPDLNRPFILSTASIPGAWQRC